MLQTGGDMGSVVRSAGLTSGHSVSVSVSVLYQFPTTKKQLHDLYERCELVCNVCG